MAFLLSTPGATVTDYQIEILRSEDSGRYMMPVAGPTPQASQVVVVHAPINSLGVAWVATRTGGPPAVPDPYAVEIRGQLYYLRGAVGVLVPPPVGDGNHIFSLSGVYWYGYVNAPGLTSGLQLGQMPWENGDSTVNDLDGSIFQPGILSRALGQAPQSGQTVPPLFNPLQG